MQSHPSLPAPGVRERECHEHRFAVADGTKLFYRAWLPLCEADSPRRTLVLLHRGHEHSGRLADVVSLLGQDDADIFAWDARGHGLSEGPRGAAPSFGMLVADLDAFMRHLHASHGVSLERTVVIAHSVGAVIASTWVHDYAPPIRALVLATPAFRVRLYVPFATFGLRAMLRARGVESAFIESYVRSRMLTHDETQARRYDSDELITRRISIQVLLGMKEAAARVVADAAAIRVPTLLLCGGADWVVSIAEQQRFFAGLGAIRKRYRCFPEMYHDILHERGRRAVIDEVNAFVSDAFEHGDAAPTLVEADRYGATQAEYERLRAPLPVGLGRVQWALMRLAMRSIGRLSRGVSIGWRHGFDSGATLDYIYANEASGTSRIGRAMDRAYLDTAGWRGIRARKRHVEELLTRAIRELDTAGVAPHVLDIATGGGRYVLDAIASVGETAVTAELRDWCPENLDLARALAHERGIRGVTFAQGDAFDEERVGAATPAPNVAIVSGLYELFADNAPVRASLRGLARALSRGAAATGQRAYLVYTGQPWHPQIDMIARVLINREGAPWVMRRRAQAEMDELAREAGFTKLCTRVDDDGIFTVSLAYLAPPSVTGGDAVAATPPDTGRSSAT